MHSGESSVASPVAEHAAARDDDHGELRPSGDLEAMRADLAAANELCDQLKATKATQDMAEQLAEQLFGGVMDNLVEEPPSHAPPIEWHSQKRKAPSPDGTSASARHAASCT